MLLRENSTNKIYCSQKILAAPHGANKTESIGFDALPGAIFFVGTIFVIKLVAYAPQHTANTIQIS